MITFIKKVKYPLAVIMFLMMTAGNYLMATTINQPSDKDSQKNNDQNTLQAREFKGVFDLQKNTVSNVDFYTTNYGIFGYDIARNRGGGFWPRSSQNQYIFAGGFWFAAKKYRKKNNDTVSYVSVTYNPNSGKGWYVPGRINIAGPNNTTLPDEDAINNDDIFKYRTYFSTDFNPSNGQVLDNKQQYNWPIWDASTRTGDTLKTDRYFGYFVPQTDLRNTTNFSKGPAFISGEDIFSTYKDTDLGVYEGGRAARAERGYPLRLQVEQMIYSWGFGDYRDFIFIKYEITNYSKDTLWQCWLSPVMDVDIARALQSNYGAGNDKAKFYDCDTTLNLAVQWTNTERGEFGYGFGYLGFDFLESPAVQKYYEMNINEVKDSFGNIIRIDTTYTLRPYDEFRDTTLPNFVRKDSAFYANSSQLGIVTFRNWSIQFDPQEDEERYQFLSSKVRDGDTGPGDKRFMMATGEFNMRPGDTARVVVGIILGNTAKGGEADGTCADLAELARKDIFAQAVYDNNFRAPTPPDRAVIKDSVVLNDGTVVKGYRPLNNGVTIQWDSTSEMSVDIDEKGMDFMGYIIYRARRSDLDGYSENSEKGNAEFPLGRGPLGWKPVRTFSISTPFVKSAERAGNDQEAVNMPFIDNFLIVGPNVDQFGNVVDTMSVKVMRIGRGITPLQVLVPNPYTDDKKPSILQVGLLHIDTTLYTSPWGKDWKRIINEDPTISFEPNGTLKEMIVGQKRDFLYRPERHHYIFDSVLIGVANLNRGLLKFNPMFYKRTTLNRKEAYFKFLDTVFPDWVVGKYTIEKDTTNGQNKTVYIRHSTDSIYIQGSRKIVVIGDTTTGKEDSISVVDVWVPRDMKDIMSDATHITEIKDSLMSYIRNNLVKMDFPEYESREYTRKHVIAPYMAEITNNRTFTDIGDDNPRDGWINPSSDPEVSEKLINNIEYFYKILAFDEGDYRQPTESKFNIGTPGLSNFVTTYPTAAPADKKTELKIIYVDSVKLGGLSNFKFFAVDPDRVQQRFAGDTLELSLDPFWSSSGITLGGGNDGFFGLYRSLALVKSRRTGDTLFNAIISYENRPCYFFYNSLFTEDAASFVQSDTLIVDNIGGNNIDFGMPNARGIKTRTGSFNSGDFADQDYCYAQSWTESAYGMLGFGFDFTIQQYAGRFRGDGVEVAPGVEANFHMNFIKDDTERIKDKKIDAVMTTQPVSFDFNTLNSIYGSFNNGPAIYEIEFLPGGSDTLDLRFNENNLRNTFVAPYLNLRVRNVIEYNRPVAAGLDSVPVRYPLEVTHMSIPNVYPVQRDTIWQGAFRNDAVYYPDPRSLGRLNIPTNEYIGKYNIHSFAFVTYQGAKFTRNSFNDVNVEKLIARPATGPGSDKKDMASIGTQGRYYKSGLSIDLKDTIDFVNRFNGGGVQFIFDFINAGQVPSVTSWGGKKDPDNYDVYSVKDFKAGDKVYLKTYGGALGLPMPGTKILAVVTPQSTGDSYLTDEMLDKIQISPNPYYITHAGVKSPYDSKIYFSKLPPKAKIEIFTVAGDLITTINHDEYNNDGVVDRSAVQVWDLLSKNRQRVQSQALIAVITSPNGAKTIKNFSVVVGGFRLTEQ